MHTRTQLKIKKLGCEKEMGKDKNERRTPWCGYTIKHLMPSIALRNTAVILASGRSPD